MCRLEGSLGSFLCPPPHLTSYWCFIFPMRFDTQGLQLSVLIYRLSPLSILLAPDAILATLGDLGFKLESCEFA